MRHSPAAAPTRVSAICKDKLQLPREEEAGKAPAGKPVPAAGLGRAGAGSAVLHGQDVLRLRAVINQHQLSS